MEVSGRVVKKEFAEGTKSDHPAIYLVSSEGEYLLRCRSANPLLDPELEALTGHLVGCQGVLHGYTFILTSYEIVG